jgi:hypothetical protein
MRKPYMSPYGDYWSSVHFREFGYVTEIIFTHSIAESLGKRQDMFLPGEEMLGLYQEDPNRLFIAISSSYGVVAHESWHAIYHMLQRIGAEVDNEVVAHCLGYMVDQILSFRRQLEICYPKEFKKVRSVG